MRTVEAGYREVPHTADVALEVRGRSLEELFVQAAQGLFSLVATIEPQAPISAERQVHLSAPDWETLLVDWLNELLSLYDEHHETYVVFDLTLPHQGELAAHIHGTRAYHPRRTVKAATFHELAIRKKPDGYCTVIVFDV